MGIFINMIISKSVTREEWEKVYEETRETVTCAGSGAGNGI